MSEDSAADAGSEKQRSRLAFLFRPAVLITLTILAILVAIPLIYRASRFSGIPPIDEIVDRKVEKRIKIDPDKNAFTYYQRAWRQLPPDVDWQALRESESEPPAEPGV